MFNKLYKEANDEIPINTELLICLKSEAAKDAHKKRRIPYSFVYKYGFAAAAVLIVTISLRVLPKTEEVVIDDAPAELISESFSVKSTDDENAHEAEIVENDVFTQNTDNARNSNIGTARSTVSKNARNEQSNPVNSEKAAVSSDITESSSAGSTETVQVQASSDDAKNSGIAMLSEDGNISEQSRKSTAVEIPDDENNGSVTFGIDSEFPSFALPEDMYTVCESVDTGNPFFVYSGDAKQLTITIFPDSAEVAYAMEKSGTIDFYGGKIKEHSDSSFTVYIVINDTGYVIESTGLSKDEIQNIINSIN